MKNSDITMKDLIVGAFAVLIAVIGFFISQRLASIDNSISQLLEFQRAQIQVTEMIKGKMEMLGKKDIELEKKDNELEKRIGNLENKK
jgi:hypothetical protein